MHVARVSDGGAEPEPSVLCDRVSSLDKVRSDLCDAVIRRLRDPGIGPGDAGMVVLPPPSPAS